MCVRDLHSMLLSFVQSLVLLDPSTDSFRDDVVEDSNSVPKMVAQSVPISMPTFRKSPKKSTSEQEDEKVSLLRLSACEWVLPHKYANEVCDTANSDRG